MISCTKGWKGKAEGDFRLSMVKGGCRGGRISGGAEEKDHG
jgi:hypothetical protein